VYGIPPTVAIEQRLSRGGRKSTVGTTTEVWHFLRLLYVKLGTQHCVQRRRRGAAANARQHCRAAAQALPRPAHRPAGAAGGQPQGRVHRAGRLGAPARLHPPAGGRQLSAHHRLPAHRPLQGTHHRAAGGRLGCDARERGAAARQAGRGAGARQGRGACAEPLWRPGAAMETAAGRGIGQVQVFSTKRACPVCAPAMPSWTRACSPTTASTAGAPTAWARACKLTASSARC
jgi:excinuclease ABC subunit A